LSKTSTQCGWSRGTSHASIEQHIPEVVAASNVGRLEDTIAMVTCPQTTTTPSMEADISRIHPDVTMIHPDAIMIHLLDMDAMNLIDGRDLIDTSKSEAMEHL